MSNADFDKLLPYPETVYCAFMHYNRKNKILYLISKLNFEFIVSINCNNILKKVNRTVRFTRDLSLNFLSLVVFLFV